MDNGLIFPYHLRGAITDGVTQEDRPDGCWICRSKLVGGVPRQIREPIPNPEKRWGGLRPTNWLIPHCLEKPLGSLLGDRTVNGHT